MEEAVKTGRIGSRPYWAYQLALLLRVAHQLGAAIVLAACLLDTLPEPPRAYVLAAFLSGVLLFVVEGWRHRQLWREFAGSITIGKTLLLGAASHGFLPLPATILLIFIVASFGAHAPKQVRHRLLF